MVLGGLYHCAKCGCDQYISFDNIIFGRFGLKMPILVPKAEIVGNLTP